MATQSKKVIAPKSATNLTTRDLSWFSERVERGRKEVFLEIVTITPDIAKRMLEMNNDNRNINEKLINTIATDILHGNWVLNGETIIVSKDGFLNDGQHRLLAVIAADRPIQSAMMFGVDRASRTTIDMGRARLAADFLHMTGVPSANLAAAVAGLWSSYSHGEYGYHRHSWQDIIKFHRHNAEDIGNAIRHVFKNAFARSVNATPIAVAYLVLRKVNATATEIFLDNLFLGANLGKNDAILWLRNKLMMMVPERKRAWEKLEMILRYWNAWRTEAWVTRHFTIVGSYPKIEP